jgi:hypothetical protein
VEALNGGEWSASRSSDTERDSTNYTMKCLGLSVLPTYEVENLAIIDTMKYPKPGSSVSTVSVYGLDDRAIEVRSPAEAKVFSL